ncbi:MAG TPA: AAA family ATPase [Thermoanaerobaculia bacterium]|nr:AAA family ATPase [Thermoanaerobaculia bacterium]
MIAAPVQPGSRLDAPYATSWEHLADELHRLDHLLHLRLLDRQHEAGGDPLEPFKGLVLSEQEILRLLAGGSSAPPTPAGTAGDPGLRSRAAAALDELSLRISRRLEASAQAGTDLALPRLSRIFHLGPFEERCILLCLAPEVDRKYEKLYAWLQDDVTRRRPTVGLVLELLCATREEALAARAAFEPQATLVKARLLQIDGNGGSLPLPSRPLKLEDRIAGFLLGGESVAPAVQNFTERVLPGTDPERRLACEDLRQRVGELLRERLGGPEPGSLVLHLRGPWGTEKSALIRAVCADLGLPLVVGDLERMLADTKPLDETAWLLAREAALQPAALCLRGFDRLFGEGQAALDRDRLRLLLEPVQILSRLTFLLGERPWNPAGVLELEGFLALEMPMPDGTAARALWEERLAGLPLAATVDAGALASRFRLTPGQIRNAVEQAGNLARWHSPGDGTVSEADLAAACRAQAGLGLAKVARKVEPGYGWEDLVLPPDQMEQLREICARATHRHVVFGDWGFGRRLSLGKGLNALFSGPPGTGKTMAAEVVARELGLDLYKIDLSQVVSKYIGETEKNLDRVFAAAESSNAILFFDEADALFGKRSEVRDSHDRYANVEVSYLLQKMEEYEGIAILASNLRQHLDQAFLRRLGFTVHFPFPDEGSRRRIWEGAWPAETPLHGDLDFAALAREYRLAGGNIRNIVVAAAFLAAAGGGPVRQSHLLRATRREYQKMGKTLAGIDPAGNAGNGSEAAP